MATLAATAFLAAALVACRAQQSQENISDKQAIEKPTLQRMPVVEPPFDRERMLLAVARAASAHTAGLADSAAQRPLDGKQFEVRLRFGCDGPGPGTGDYGWSIDPDGRTLRLRATPDLSLDDEVAKSLVGDQVEAVEGFWLPRPWLLQAACPSGRPIDDATASRGELEKTQETEAEESSFGNAELQRIGIAQFFTPEDARTRRRMNRPFQAVKQLDEGQEVGQSGFDLVLSGRLRARRDGRVILCAGSGIDRPPACIVSATIDRVWIEFPEDKAVMAEWST